MKTGLRPRSLDLLVQCWNEHLSKASVKMFSLWIPALDEQRQVFFILTIFVPKQIITY